MSSSKKYTVRDIENYHKGLLNPAERHALEKTALDDPFLAEAIEGFAMAAVDSTRDLEELKQRLADRTGKATGRKARLLSMPLLRAAAMILFIAGAGYLVYQFAFNKTENSPLASKEEKKQPDAVSDTLQTTAAIDSQNQSLPGLSAERKEQTDSGTIEFTAMNKGKAASQVKETKVANELVREDLALNRSGEEKLEIKTAIPASEKPDQKLDALAKQDDPKKEKDLNAGAARNYEKIENIGISSKRSGPSRQQNLNQFRGRVTDEANNPLPFANISTTKYNVGTYADVNGNFNLVSTDTILDVQVRSVGFESYNVQLKDDVSENRIVLQEDRQISPIVLDKARSNTVTRAGYNNNMQIEEPEPEDGWANYDTYLANNLKMPQELKEKNNFGDVEISFEVNKNGEPVNIKIEKSLCSKCDKEAVRLIKEGPRWKRKNKKGRASVKIPFTNYHE